MLAEKRDTSRSSLADGHRPNITITEFDRQNSLGIGHGQRIENPAKSYGAGETIRKTSSRYGSEFSRAQAMPTDQDDDHAKYLSLKGAG